MYSFLLPPHIPTPPQLWAGLCRIFPSIAPRSSGNFGAGPSRLGMPLEELLRHGNTSKCHSWKRTFHGECHPAQGLSPEQGGVGASQKCCESFWNTLRGFWKPLTLCCQREAPWDVCGVNRGWILGIKQLLLAKSLSEPLGWAGEGSYTKGILFSHRLWWQGSKLSLFGVFVLFPSLLRSQNGLGGKGFKGII